MKGFISVVSGLMFSLFLMAGLAYAVIPGENVGIIDGTDVVGSANPLHTTCNFTGSTMACTNAGTDAAGAAVTAKPVLVGGTDGTDARSFLTDALGKQIITLPVGDPCQNPTIAKSSAVISIGSAATTYIVTTSASTTIYVCSFTGSLVGTTPSVTFKTGTHVTNDCDTNPAALSGVILPLTGTLVSMSGPGTIMKSSAGGQICATTVGTGSSFQGILSYVQQ